MSTTYGSLRSELRTLIEHLSDLKQRPSAAIIKRASDRLTGMALDGTTLLDLLARPDDADLRMRTLKHLVQLEQIIERKAARSHRSRH